MPRRLPVTVPRGNRQTMRSGLLALFATLLLTVRMPCAGATVGAGGAGTVAAGDGWVDRLPFHLGDDDEDDDGGALEPPGGGSPDDDDDTPALPSAPARRRPPGKGGEEQLPPSRQEGPSPDRPAEPAEPSPTSPA